MARFVVVIEDGEMKLELEAENGQVVSADVAAAYSLMQAGHALSQIADRLGELVETTSHVADAVEQHG